MSWLRSRREVLFFAVSVVLLVAGAAARGSGEPAAADALWASAAGIGLVVSLAEAVAAVRRREFGVDVVALLALAGALAVGESFAGAVIAVMLAGGSLLEARAEARARRDLGRLAQRSPRSARLRVGGTLITVEADEVRPGDHLLVGPGEVVPVDGRLLTAGDFDESALTGEAEPVERPAGDEIRSGVVTGGRPVDLVATATAEDSTYAGVVRLVAQAQAASAPFVRLADRIAVVFAPLTLALAGAAWWATADPVRAVAVLVVATPCPLLLAVPIAFMSGLARAARSGVVVKGGAVLERLAAGRVLLFDKTGTLTQGRPVLRDIVTDRGRDPGEVLRLAASLDQVSAHVLAGGIVAESHRWGLSLDPPQDVEEHPGYGVEGRVGDRRVSIGRGDWIVTGPAPQWVRQVRRRASLDGSLTVFVAIDDEPAGAFLLHDPVRSDAPRMVRTLRSAGMERIVLVTGDRPDAAERVGRITGVDAVVADRDPAGKLAVLAEERRHGPTIMVGDGINDAPALAAAEVGVALAARGATASSEAADVVLTVDRVDALADAVFIAKRARRTALESAAVGMGLSLLAMGVAAAGLLPPAVGAALQEVIDVAAILAALRALLPGAVPHRPLAAIEAEVGEHLHAGHRSLRPVIEEVRSVADSLSAHTRDLGPVRHLLAELETRVIPHARAEQTLLYPAAARAVGGSDSFHALTRGHVEIEHQVSRLHRLLDEVAAHVPEPEDLVELTRLLYGLYAVWRLYDVLAEEGPFSLLPHHHGRHGNRQHGPGRPVPHLTGDGAVSPAP